MLIAAVCLAGIAQATTNEISVKVSLKVDKNFSQLSKDSGTLQIQMAGTRYNTQVLSCTPTNAAMVKGSVSSAGYTYWRNLATNNTVYISTDEGTTTNMMLKAGEAAMFRLLPAVDISKFVAATLTGTADLEFTIVED